MVDGRMTITFNLLFMRSQGNRGVLPYTYNETGHIAVDRNFLIITFNIHVYMCIIPEKITMAMTVESVTLI